MKAIFCDMCGKGGAPYERYKGDKNPAVNIVIEDDYGKHELDLCYICQRKVYQFINECKRKQLCNDAEWIVINGDYDIYEGVYPDKYKCSKCGYIFTEMKQNCPHCNAKMRGCDSVE